MKRPESTKRRKQTSLRVQLDEDCKTLLSRAAKLRGIGIGEYVRNAAVDQAKREIEAAKHQSICMTPDEQLAFWTALYRKPRLTAAQRRLGAVMRGES